jgi:hypothetical protein
VTTRLRCSIARLTNPRCSQSGGMTKEQQPFHSGSSFNEAKSAMIGHPQFRPALCEDSPASWEIADGFTYIGEYLHAHTLPMGNFPQQTICFADDDLNDLR